MKITTEHAATYRGKEYWTAIDSDSYDGPSSPIGSDNTEVGAMLDLMRQLFLEDE